MLVIESAMGLFDGAGSVAGRTGAAADLAARFALPVILVLDVSGQSQTAAAVARGFATHDPAVRIAGVIANRVGSERHRAGILGALDRLPLPLLGAVPRDASIALPERHLGLVQADEHGALPDPVVAPGRYGRTPPRSRRDRLHARRPIAAGRMEPRRALPSPGQRIALARDAAFSFVYAHVLDGWRRQGCGDRRHSPRSPTNRRPTIATPAGSPAATPSCMRDSLAAAGSVSRRACKAFAETRPVHGECGGHMVLGATLQDADGVTHAMLNLLSHATSYARRKMHLGYREATLSGSLRAGRGRHRVCAAMSSTTRARSIPAATCRSRA